MRIWTPDTGPKRWWLFLIAAAVSVIVLDALLYLIGGLLPGMSVGATLTDMQLYVGQHMLAWAIGTLVAWLVLSLVYEAIRSGVVRKPMLSVGSMVAVGVSLILASVTIVVVALLIPIVVVALAMLGVGIYLSSLTAMVLTVLLSWTIAYFMYEKYLRKHVL